MNEVQAKIYLVKYPSSLDDRTILHVFPEDYSRICGSVDRVGIPVIQLPTLSDLFPAYLLRSVVSFSIRFPGFSSDSCSATRLPNRPSPFLRL